jgi:hypothetical protein
MANFDQNNMQNVHLTLPHLQRALPGVPGYVYVGIDQRTGKHLYSYLLTPAGCSFAEWEWRTKVGGPLPYRIKITPKGNPREAHPC